jgi:hypothetical protein
MKKGGNRPKKHGIKKHPYGAYHGNVDALALWKIYLDKPKKCNK